MERPPPVHLCGGLHRRLRLDLCLSCQLLPCRPSHRRQRTRLLCSDELLLGGLLARVTLQDPGLVPGCDLLHLSLAQLQLVLCMGTGGGRNGVGVLLGWMHARVTGPHVSHHSLAQLQLGLCVQWERRETGRMFRPVRMYKHHPVPHTACHTRPMSLQH